MSALSPMQIPFWFGWSTVLLTKNILRPIQSHYNSYITGIGFGTLLGNCVFIFGGKLIGQRLNNNQHVVNWIIGGIFAITAAVQLWKIFTNKRVEQRLEHPEEETRQYEDQIEELSKEN
jgi:hypothetical protein